MSRKDYAALAAAFAHHEIRPDGSSLADEAAENMRRDLIREVANVLAADNYRFDRSRFYAAARMPD